MEVKRKQRLSDDTITVEGVRYELPAAYRTLLWVNVRVARWDLSSVDLVDPHSGAHLSTLLLLDREKNADRRRRALPSHDQNVPDTDAASRRTGIAPLLQKQMADYAATGLPPAYLTKEHSSGEGNSALTFHAVFDSTPSGNLHHVWHVDENGADVAF